MTDFAHSAIGRSLVHTVTALFKESGAARYFSAYTELGLRVQWYVDGRHFEMLMPFADLENALYSELIHDLNVRLKWSTSPFGGVVVGVAGKWRKFNRRRAA